MAKTWKNIKIQECKKTNDYVYQATCPHCGYWNYGHYDGEALIEILNNKTCDNCGKKA